MSGCALITPVYLEIALFSGAKDGAIKERCKLHRAKNGQTKTTVRVHRGQNIKITQRREGVSQFLSAHRKQREKQAGPEAQGCPAYRTSHRIRGQSDVREATSAFLQSVPM